jgi:hypothetical protein
LKYNHDNTETRRKTETLRISPCPLRLCGSIN